MAKSVNTPQSFPISNHESMNTFPLFSYLPPVFYLESIRELEVEKIHIERLRDLLYKQADCKSPEKDGHDLPAVLRPALQAGKTWPSNGSPRATSGGTRFVASAGLLQLTQTNRFRMMSLNQWQEL